MTKDEKYRSSKVINTKPYLLYWALQSNNHSNNINNNTQRRKLRGGWKPLAVAFQTNISWTTGDPIGRRVQAHPYARFWLDRASPW